MIFQTSYLYAVNISPVTEKLREISLRVSNLSSFKVGRTPVPSISLMTDALKEHDDAALKLLDESFPRAFKTKKYQSIEALLDKPGMSVLKEGRIQNPKFIEILGGEQMAASFDRYPSLLRFFAKLGDTPINGQFTFNKSLLETFQSLESSRINPLIIKKVKLMIAEVINIKARIALENMYHVGNDQRSVYNLYLSLLSIKNNEIWGEFVDEDAIVYVRNFTNYRMSAKPLVVSLFNKLPNTNFDYVKYIDYISQERPFRFFLNEGPLISIVDRLFEFKKIMDEFYKEMLAFRNAKRLDGLFDQTEAHKKMMLSLYDYLDNHLEMIGPNMTKGIVKFLYRYVSDYETLIPDTSIYILEILSELLKKYPHLSDEIDNPLFQKLH